MDGPVAELPDGMKGISGTAPDGIFPVKIFYGIGEISIYEPVLPCVSLD